MKKPNLKQVKATLSKIQNKIQDNQSFEDLLKFRSKAYLISKKIEEQKKAITAPMRESINEANKFFKPIEEQYSEICSYLDPYLLEYRDSQKKKINSSMDEIEANPAKFEEQLNSDLVELKNKYSTEDATIYFRDDKKVVVTDESKIPEMYLSPDMAKIKADIKAGKKINGVSLEDRETIVVRKK